MVAFSKPLAITYIFDGEKRQFPRSRQQIKMKFSCNCLMLCAGHIVYHSLLEIATQDFKSTFAVGKVGFVYFGVGFGCFAGGALASHLRYYREYTVFLS